MSSVRRASSRASLVIVTLAIAATASGCLSPYLRRAPDVPPEKPSPALVSGLVVRFDAGAQQKSLVSMAIDSAQNAGLAEFGDKATSLLASALAERGYEVTYDRARTKELDTMQLSSNSATAALTGQWRHPEASYWTPDMVDSLFVKPADIVGKLNGDAAPTYFAFADVTIRDTGWFFIKEPTVVVRAVVYDRDARKVLDLQGIGQGDSTAFVADRSPQNLERALSRGFESLKTVQEEAL